MSGGLYSKKNSLRLGVKVFWVLLISLFAVESSLAQQEQNESQGAEKNAEYPQKKVTIKPRAVGGAYRKALMENPYVKNILLMTGEPTVYKSGEAKWKTEFGFIGPSYLEIGNQKAFVDEAAFLEGWNFQATGDTAVFLKFPNGANHIHIIRSKAYGEEIDLGTLKDFSEIDSEAMRNAVRNGWMFSRQKDPMNDEVNFLVVSTSKGMPFSVKFFEKGQKVLLSIGEGNRLLLSDTVMRVDKNKMVVLSEMDLSQQGKLLSPLLKGQVLLTRYRDKYGDTVLSELDLKGFQLAYEYTMWRIGLETKAR